MCDGKGVIHNEKIKSHEDSNSVPKGGFFSKTEFYSSLKNEIIDDKSYESIKKFWKFMRLNKPSELNDIYNFRNTIILCKISENRSIKIMQKFPYNLQKCTSASYLSGCTHRFLLKTIIALPMWADSKLLLP